MAEDKTKFQWATVRNLLRRLWPFPDFGWDALVFSDKLKLASFFIQAGGGISMTAYAAYAMYKLAQMKAVWPVFYLGAMALALVGIVFTGLASLLIKRAVDMQVGPIKLKTTDAEAAVPMMAAAAAALPTSTGDAPVSQEQTGSA